MNRRAYLIVAALGASWLSGCASLSSPAALGRAAATRPTAATSTRNVALGQPRTARSQPVIASAQRPVIQQTSGRLPSLEAPGGAEHYQQLPMPTKSEEPGGVPVGPPPVFAAPPPEGVIAGPGMPGWTLPDHGWRTPLSPLKNWLHLHGLAAPPGGITFGVGAYYVKPHWSDNPAYGAQYVTNQATGAVASLHVSDFRYDYDVAPRVWLAFDCCDGLGIRGRYWRFDDGAQEHLVDLVGTRGSANDQSIIIPGPLPFETDLNDVVAFRNSLRMDVGDLELTQAWQMGCWDLKAAAGLRYARINQDASAVRAGRSANQTPTAAVSTALDLSNNFRGIGPVLALEGRRPFGCCGLGVYGGLRGALLVGDNDQNATRVSVLVGEGTPFVQSANFDRSRRDVLPMAEIEFGIEWAKDLGCSRWVVQAGYAGQIWWDAGSATTADGHLALSGWTFSLGVSW